MGCCCSGASGGMARASYIVGGLDTAAGTIPQVSTALALRDFIGACMVRLSIRRMSYSIAPGLYAVGAPEPDAPVLVTANYKLTFDCLRRELTGRNLWLLVLDTKGVNVWCAAGKGTFGTEELLRRIEATRLAEIVTGRTLVLPQLGAPGVSAHEVRQRSGFSVVYGPVRASDLPAFLDSNMQATAQMRQVRFAFRDRVAVVPVEFVASAKWLAYVVLALLLLGGIDRSVFSVEGIWVNGVPAVLTVCAGYLLGTVGAPLLLPCLPGRAFALKGAVLGGVVAGLGIPAGVFSFHSAGDALLAVSGILATAAVSSFLAMIFTGASTFTSLSGVRKEMRTAVPLQLVALVCGLSLWMAARFM